MGRKDLPEGLEEMAKDTDGVDRRELEETYDELVDEIRETTVERRTVLRAFAGGGGLAVLNTLFAQKKYMGEDFESGLKTVEEYSDEPLGVQNVEDPPYRVDDEMYERPSGVTDFDRGKSMMAWMKAEGAKPSSMGALLEKGMETGGTSIKSTARGSEPIVGESVGTVRSHHALSDAIQTLNRRYGPFSFGRTEDRMDVQKLTAEGHFSSSHLIERSPDVSDPSVLTSKLNTVARIMGSGDVGVAELDERWFRKRRRGDRAPITFENIERPVIDGEQTAIPKQCDRVVVGLVEMPLFLNQTSPTQVSSAATRMGYGRMGVASVGVATWIRSMGYNAIPLMNDTSLSVPQAIDAGLGQYGRHGRLIHPEFGSNVRPWKVVTDMPLDVDPFINFGATEFCKGCKLCAEHCPSNTHPYGERTWKYEGPAPASWEQAADSEWDQTKTNGVYKWYQKPQSCLRFWTESGPSCSNCMVVCPFTQGRSWLHDIIRELAGRNQSLDSTMADMSGLFGYEQLRRPEEMWRQEYLPFGLSQDPGLDAD